MCSFLLLFCAAILCIATSAGSHTFTKRQTDEEEEHCSQVLTRELCTGGLFEAQASSLLQCNFSGTAMLIRESCITNSMGFFCTSRSDELFRNISIACRGIDDGLSTTCPTNCRNALLDARAQLGCCVSLFNDSSNFVFEPEPLRNSLWSLCNVEPVVDRCAPSPIDLSQVQIETTCSAPVFQQRINDNAFCRRDFVDSIFAELASENCEDLSIREAINELCAVNEAGQFCSVQLSTIEGLFQKAFTNCEGTTSVCDPSCTSALTDAVNTTGCCFISEYNRTDEVSRDWLSFEFWQRCNLASPGFCAARLNNAADLRASERVIGYAVAVLFTMAVSFL